MIACENIKIYCFANETDITTDLSNYADSIHYINYISERIMAEISWDHNRLSAENYREAINSIRDFYKNYDYASLKP